jgi:hypothetical protein
MVDFATKSSNPDIATLLAPARRLDKNRNLTAALYKVNKRGNVIHLSITNTVVGGKLPPEDQIVVDKVEAGLNALPGVYSKCTKVFPKN